MRRNIRLSFGALLTGVVLLFAGFGMANAATDTGNPGGNGLRVSPVRSDVVLKPGETRTLDITVTNVTSAPARLQAIINDFVGSSDESGNPAIILDPKQFAPSHSLKRYIKPIENFSLQPGQQKNVTITINIPANAAGGGYFGAIRFAPAGEIGDKDKTVSLAGSVGSLILAKVTGDIKEQVSIASFDVRRDDRPNTFFTTNKNLAVTARFQNQGNVQVAPFGKIMLKDRSGKVLSTFELNNTTPPGNVLPDSIRKYSVPLKKVGRFGQFKLEGNFGYGTNGQLLSASTTFYVIPMIYIIIFVALVLFLAFLIFGLPRIIRAYNRRVLRRAGRR